jgi:hypothetical protein
MDGSGGTDSRSAGDFFGPNCRAIKCAQQAIHHEDGPVIQRGVGTHWLVRRLLIRFVLPMQNYQFLFINATNILSHAARLRFLTPYEAGTTITMIVPGDCLVAHAWKRF